MNSELIMLKGKNLNELPKHNINVLDYKNHDLVSYVKYINTYYLANYSVQQYALLSMPLFCIDKSENGRHEQHVLVLVKYSGISNVILTDVVVTTNHFEMQTALKSMIDMINTLDSTAKLKTEPVQVMQIVEEMEK